MEVIRAGGKEKVKKVYEWPSFICVLLPLSLSSSRGRSVTGLEVPLPLELLGPMTIPLCVPGISHLAGPENSRCPPSHFTLPFLALNLTPLQPRTQFPSQ